MRTLALISSLFVVVCSGCQIKQGTEKDELGVTPEASARVLRILADVWDKTGATATSLDDRAYSSVAGSPMTADQIMRVSGGVPALVEATESQDKQIATLANKILIMMSGLPYKGKVPREGWRQWWRSEGSKTDRCRQRDGLREPAAVPLPRVGAVRRPVSLDDA